MWLIGSLVIIFLSVSIIFAQNNGLKKLKLVAEWSRLDFVFPRPDLRELAIRNGQFVQQNCIPIDVDVDYRDSLPSRIFVSVPRFITGIPATFGYVTGSGNLIQPYPQYSWHSSHGADCDGITSVFRVTIDKCQRLWILDTGRIGAQQFCPPQILIFDLKTDELVHRYRFPPDQFKSGISLFISIVLDVKDPPPYGQCRDTTAYIADVTGFGIMVYDYRQNRSWRTENKLFYSDPDFGTHTIAGESFDLMDGVFGLALTPADSRRRERFLYFHALASNTENSVRLDVMNNATVWLQNVQSTPREFRQIGLRQSQATAQAMDRNGNLFYGLENPIGVACWDSDRPYTRENTRIVLQDDKTLQFSSGLKVVLNKKNKEELWVMTCRFQKVMTGTLSDREINFRIQALQVDEILGGDKCIQGGFSGSSSPNRPSYLG